MGSQMARHLSLPLAHLWELNRTQTSPTERCAKVAEYSQATFFQYPALSPR
jgi:hypothetical protein